MATTAQEDPAPAEKELDSPQTSDQEPSPEKAVTKAVNQVPLPPPVKEKSSEDDEQREYPSGTRLALIIIGLVFALFLVVLDNSIVANAIPKITDQFNSVSDIGWYGSSYLLTTSAFQLLYGKVYTSFSIKYTFLAGITIFELGSLVCGLAPTSKALIIGRAVAGIGCSGIFAGVMIIVSYAAPLHRRPLIMGMMGGIFAVGSVCGPLLGGAFTDRLSWRWCFYINLPFGAITIFTLLFFFTDPVRPSVSHIPRRQRIASIDLMGMLCFMPAVVCLILALEWGGSVYPWNNGRIIALFVVAGIMAIAFAAVEYWEGENATIPPQLVRNRSIMAAAWWTFFNSGAFYTMLYYIPLWHQVIRGQSAVESGIRMLPLVIGMVISVMLGGGLTAKIGYYAPFLILTSTALPIATGLVSTWTVTTTFSQWVGYQAFVGLSEGFGTQQPMITVQTVLPTSDIPRGTSMIAFVQTLGASIWLAVSQAVFENRLLADLRGVDLGPTLQPADLLNIGATNVANVVPAAALPAVLNAFDNALSRTYLLATAMAATTMVGSLAMEWKSVKKSKKKDDKEAAEAPRDKTDDDERPEGTGGEGSKDEGEDVGKKGEAAPETKAEE